MHCQHKRNCPWAEEVNTQDIEKVKEFVGDFNKRFEDLKLWTEDAEEIRA